MLFHTPSSSWWWMIDEERQSCQQDKLIPSVALDVYQDHDKYRLVSERLTHNRLNKIGKQTHKQQLFQSQ